MIWQLLAILCAIPAVGMAIFLWISGAHAMKDKR